MFTFGAGVSGQLGHNVRQNEVLPRKVFELMGSGVSQIACGRCEFTSCKRRLLVRKYGKIAEIAEIPFRVCCSRCHLLALTPATGRIYSCGLGGSGQLGNNLYDCRAVPSLVKGPLVPYNREDFKVPDTPVSSSAEWRPCVVKFIRCANDQCFATVSLQSVSIITCTTTRNNNGSVSSVLGAGPIMQMLESRYVFTSFRKNR